MTYYETIALLVVILGWPISAYFAYRAGLHSQERADIRQERAGFIPIIKQAIFDCGSGNQPLYAWRHHAGNLKDGARRFSTFLKGRRQTAFDATWQKCADTKDAELLDKKGGWFADGDTDLKWAQKVIAARLQALLDIVERP